MPAADDVEAIRTLIHRYAELVDLGELDAVAELFAHATWRSSVRDDVLCGTEQVRRAYDGVVLYDGIPRTKHVISNVAVELAADAATATARSYFTVLQARPDLPLQLILSGRYDDRLEHVDGAWRFADCLIIPDFIGNLGRHMVAGSVSEEA
jgi:3-phenylpropionate/cinnamic acid dioxygenase small subunit